MVSALQPRAAAIRRAGRIVVARPVPADPIDREEMRRKTGTDEIPAMLLDDGTAVTGDADALIAHLDAAYSERRMSPSIARVPAASNDHR
jgi:hypothetical protein